VIKAKMRVVEIDKSERSNSWGDGTVKFQLDDFKFKLAPFSNPDPSSPIKFQIDGPLALAPFELGAYYYFTIQKCDEF
jgi:hypothetical protein